MAGFASVRFRPPARALFAGCLTDDGLEHAAGANTVDRVVRSSPNSTRAASLSSSSAGADTTW